MYVISVIGRIAVAVVLVAAVFGKLRSRDHFRAFADTVASMVPVSRWATKPVAAMVIVAELAGALLLVPDRMASIGLAVAAALLVTFTGVLALLRRRAVPCNCFGARSAPSPVGWAQFVRNGVLLALVLLAGVTSQVAGPFPGLPVAVGAAAIGVFTGVAFLLLVEGRLLPAHDRPEATNPLMPKPAPAITRR